MSISTPYSRVRERKPSGSRPEAASIAARGLGLEGLPTLEGGLEFVLETRKRRLRLGDLVAGPLEEPLPGHPLVSVGDRLLERLDCFRQGGEFALLPVAEPACPARGAIALLSLIGLCL